MIRVMGVLTPASVGGVTLEVCYGCTAPCICCSVLRVTVSTATQIGKVSWQLVVKILQKSYHTTLSHSHKIFMGGREPSRVVASAQVGGRRELNRRQCLYGISWG